MDGLGQWMKIDLNEKIGSEHIAYIEVVSSVQLDAEGNELGRNPVTLNLFASTENEEVIRMVGSFELQELDISEYKFLDQIEGNRIRYGEEIRK